MSDKLVRKILLSNRVEKLSSFLTFPREKSGVLMITKRAPNICYRLIVLSVAEQAADLVSDLHFSSPRDNGNRAEKRSALPLGDLQVSGQKERLVGESDMGTARRTKGNYGKGTKKGGTSAFLRGVIIAHVRGALTVRAIESLFYVLRGSHTPVTTIPRVRPQSGLSLSAKRYISSLSVLARKKSPEMSY